MSVTRRILKTDKTLQEYGEGKWGQDTKQRDGYHSFNDAGIESEVGELLYGIVRVLQPDRVLETGTHVGVGASYLGFALRDNKKGHLDTLEFIPPLHGIAQRRIETMRLTDYVTCHLVDAAKFEPKANYDLVLLDTEPQTRFAELLKYFDYVNAGGYIFIHDLNRHMHQIENNEHGFAWPFGPLPKEMTELVTSGKLRPFHFQTPRGLTGFYKVSPKDYKW